MLKALLFCYFFFSNFVLANEIKFYSAHFPPYSYEFEHNRGGAMYDVAQEILKRLKQPTEIRFVPWPRARFEAESQNNVLLIPLARTAEREEKYTWLIHVLDDPYVLFSLKKNTADISSHESAKKLNKIGILKASVADHLLRELGYTNLEVASNDLTNINKLKHRRIDAWVAPLSAIDQYKIKTGLGKEDIRVGVEYTVLREYIGSSKNLDPKIQQMWRDTFEEMKKDGTYKSIMKKYNIPALE